MRILVTGASGFIGRYVLAALQQHGVEVFAVGRNRPEPAVPFIEADLLTTCDFVPLLQKVQGTHLLHLAWYAEHGKYWFVQDDFLMSAIRRNSFDINYRIDDAPAQSTRWNELTNNKGAGLFGSASEGFLRDLYNAEEFFIRLTDGNGRRYDAEFDLAGIQEAIEAVAGACSMKRSGRQKNGSWCT